MTKTTRLSIGGVPEHFNHPWHLAIEEGRFADAGIDLRWVDCPGGTGQMTRGLEQGELDLAVSLSEGVIAAIARKVPIRILQWYVRTSLVWGIHVPAHSDFQSVESLRGQRFAISRHGSGSHLMAFVNADQRGWQPDVDLRFVEVGDLDGAIESFRRSASDGFMWERFTTQPYVDRGLMRRVGECPTPWPAFAIVASERLLSRSTSIVADLVRVINEVCSGVKNRSGIVETFAARYSLDRQEAADWFALTEWSSDNRVERAQLQQIIDTLARLELLEGPIEPEDCCSALCRLAG